MRRGREGVGRADLRLVEEPAVVGVLCEGALDACHGAVDVGFCHWSDCDGHGGWLRLDGGRGSACM